MGKRKKLYPKAEDELDSLKQEAAEELNLDDDIEKRGWENMTTREVGKIGGNMVKKMIKFAEKEIDERDGKIDEED
ncbi:alpha/beta-type small acid-soluble spore protein [Thermoanaerobacter siderophilus]|uniref:Small, acid-soluble spore protein, alpha/beta type n=1 Tax=Thermoanaerobacter siderophilus SR4 TaxID=880478 RepID=I9AEK8_9THEO|nr:alpha/beta-type small acid-soluble spore protein [Thermoanaerobacter siderophilus]EIW00442.1 small, acid-soluble spore protein, alpha/beta type [Thermoanaerobacter siderophilus SR4]HHY79013.1 alpha/beta-type small acid-soluble spore protein [Thermoanaerobacter sp.]